MANAKSRVVAKKTAAKKKTNPHEVTIRHGIFRYHVVGENMVGEKTIQIRHAERGETIMVNDADYELGVEHGAFYMGEGEPSSPLGKPANGEPGVDTTADDELDFSEADDDQILDYMQRHTPDEIMVKTQGEDMAVVAKVLKLEYARSDGNPQPQVLAQLVDILGENPEEDAEGNWVNEPDAEELTDAQKEQRRARQGAGRQGTTRSGRQS